MELGLGGRQLRTVVGVTLFPLLLSTSQVSPHTGLVLLGRQRHLLRLIIQADSLHLMPAHSIRRSLLLLHRLSNTCIIRRAAGCRWVC